jgi:hypothetical protein
MTCRHVQLSNSKSMLLPLIVYVIWNGIFCYDSLAQIQIYSVHMHRLLTFKLSLHIMKSLSSYQKC